MDASTSANQRVITYANLMLDPIRIVITSLFANKKTKLKFNVRT